MCCTTSLRLRTKLLAALNLFSEYVSDLVSAPWLHIRLEDEIDLFERPAHSLRIHEEHVERHDSAEYTEDNVGLPLNVVEGWCHEVSQSKIENPVGGGRQADALCSELERENLGGVNPCSRSL
jgi:hypothetical protein